jgi:hypothetical protein
MAIDQAQRRLGEECRELNREQRPRATKDLRARNKVCPAAVSTNDCCSCAMPRRLCSCAWVRNSLRCRHDESTERRWGFPGPPPKGWPTTPLSRGGGSPPDDDALVRYAKPALQWAPAVPWRHSVVALVVPQLLAAWAGRQRGAAHCRALSHTPLRGRLFWHCRGGHKLHCLPPRVR